VPKKPRAPKKTPAPAHVLPAVGHVGLTG
jgi:hypothetical protein